VLKYTAVNKNARHSKQQTVPNGNHKVCFSTVQIYGSKHVLVLLLLLLLLVIFHSAFVKKIKERIIFDIHMSMHRNIITNYSQQDTTFLDSFIFIKAVHVSGGFFAHHQEHTTVLTASGILNQYCC
jgi:hypothetical protein